MNERGFSILELTVAMTIMLAATAGVFELMLPSHGALTAQPEVADMQQRLRVATDAISRDAIAAGAGVFAGAVGAPLSGSVAPVRPYRAGPLRADLPGTFKTDTITLLSMPRTAVRSGAAQSATYWQQSDDTSGTYQLMFYDGSPNGADVPVVEHLVGLEFEYWGDAQPPMLVKPLSDPIGPWTTYGPAPSATAVAPYGPGENCLFAAGDSSTPRLAVLGDGGPALVKLTAAQLTDGPWCPDENAPDRWDADLLRIRRIAITVRVEVAITSLRGPAGALFKHGGTSQGGHSWVPDIEARFDIAPRNLNLSR
jgi:hypothetical protein